MIMPNYLTIALLNYVSHLLTDFVCQTNDIVKAKEDKKVLFNKHIFPGFLMNITILSIGTTRLFTNNNLHLKNMLITVLLIWGGHLILDIGKQWSQDKYSSSNRVHREWIIYLSDQILHIIVIAIASYFYSNKYNIYINDKLGIFMLKLLILCCVGLLVTRFTEFFISKVLSGSEELDSGTSDSVNSNESIISGRTVGTIERLLIMLAVLTPKIFSAVLAAVIALKSVSRFNKIAENEKYAVYYLVGSLTSILMALFFSYVGYWLLQMVK